MLPACRHRGPLQASNRYPCSTTWLIHSGTVAPETCLQCPYPDRPNRNDAESADRIELLSTKLQQRRGGPCLHLGPQTGEIERCNTCGGGYDVHVHTCGSSQFGPKTNLLACARCPGYQPGPPRFQPQPDDPACGVVIGSWHWPRLIALQIAVIRDTCGPVPILISDDCSEGWNANGPPITGSRYQQLEVVCQSFPDVTLVHNNGRQGHLWGDTLAFKNGIVWAAERGLAFLAKFSQRFIVNVPRWLQDSAKRLRESGCCIAGQRARHLNIRFALRTEAAILDVRQWNRPDVLAHLSPESGGIGGENWVHMAAAMIGTGLHRWHLFSPSRFDTFGGVLWHHQRDNVACAQQYHALAAQYGIRLDPDFQCGRPAGT